MNKHLIACVLALAGMVSAATAQTNLGIVYNSTNGVVRMSNALTFTNPVNVNGAFTAGDGMLVVNPGGEAELGEGWDTPNNRAALGMSAAWWTNTNSATFRSDVGAAPSMAPLVTAGTTNVSPAMLTNPTSFVSAPVAGSVVTLTNVAASEVGRVVRVWARTNLPVVFTNATTNVTVWSKSTNALPVINTRYGVATLVVVATNQWLIFGDIE
jgi:hypothetical protein